MGRVITRETAVKIHELAHEVTRLRLTEVVGHDELWGALGAAGKALEYCEQIAARDVERPAQQPPPPNARRRR